MKIKTILLLIFLCSSFFAFSKTITPEQLRQIKNLPLSQKTQLAKQLGFNLSELGQMDEKLSQASNDSMGVSVDASKNPQDSQEEQALELTTDKDELKLYGLEVFTARPDDSFSNSFSSPPSGYILGPGDELSLFLYGKENAEYLISINNEGDLVVPAIGPLKLAGLSLSEAKAYLANVMETSMIGVTANLTLSSFRDIRIKVVGEIAAPGTYDVSAFSTVTDVIYTAGGVTDIASLRNIQVRRNGQLIQSFDAYNLLNFGDSSQDINLKFGDVVFVPTLKTKVSIDGEVVRPAIYEIKTETSLIDAIKLAGGLTPNAYTKNISVERYTEDGKTQLTADLEDSDIFIQNGDYVTARPVSSAIRNSIALIGAVSRPGMYEWNEGIMLGDLLGNSHGNLLEHADKSYVLILRNLGEHNLQPLQIDLNEISANNVLLKKDDKVVIFSSIEESELTVTNIDELAFSEDILTENAKKAKETYIDEKLYWKEMQDKALANSDQESNQSFDSTLAKLDEKDIKRLSSLEEGTTFSRKKLLKPIINAIERQSRYGEPSKLVSIKGSVKVPGTYPLTENATIADLIKAAGGLSESAFLQQAELIRHSFDSSGRSTLSHKILNLKTELANNQEVTLLESKDILNVLKAPDWREGLTVKLLGEVTFPGEYSIRKGETLSQLLLRAGGITEYGDPNAAIFTRESLKTREQENLVRMAEDLRKQIASESLRQSSGMGSIISYDQAQKLLKDLSSVKSVGRLVIDLPELLDNDLSGDVVLTDGDSLIVPSKAQSVNVLGEVFVPTSHLYSSELNFSDYIERSGGFKTLADVDRAYVIRANGSVALLNDKTNYWFSNQVNGNSYIFPGDTIVVPLDVGRVDNLTLWSNATQIVYQLAVAAAAVRGF